MLMNTCIVECYILNLVMYIFPYTGIHYMGWY